MNDQQPQQEQKPKKKSKKKIWIFIILFIVFIAIIASLAGGDDATNTNTSPTTPQVNKAGNTNTTDGSAGALLDYEIVGEDDYSDFDCERVEVHITVPDDATQEDIDYTLEAVIDDYSFMWDEVTVWVDNTGDMDEYSFCE